MITRFEDFLYNLAEIDLYVHRITSREMKPLGLKGNYAMYFTKLHQHPEGLTGVQLGQLCGRDKADISRDIAALEKVGMVERRTVGSRSYRAPIVLTSRGNEVAEVILARIDEVIGRIGANYSEKERDTFYHVLEEITAALKEVGDQK